MNPVAEQISGQAEKLAARVTGWQMHTYERIGRRVKEIGEMSAADVKTLNNLQTVSGDMDAILAELAAVTNKNVSELRDMYSETLSALHLENQPLYDHRGLSFVPPEQNETINALVNAYARTTAGSFENLAASGAKRIGFVDADGRFTPLEIDYKRILDKATVSIASGAEDFHTAMRAASRRWELATMSFIGTPLSRVGRNSKAGTAHRQKASPNGRAFRKIAAVLRRQKASPNGRAFCKIPPAGRRRRGTCRACRLRVLAYPDADYFRRERSDV